MRPFWNRLKNNDKEENKLKGKLKVALKTKISTAILLFFIKILPIMIAVCLLYTAISWVIDLFDSKNNPKTLYETIGKDDLNELIAVAGDEDNGYYLAYKQGLDEKLDEVIKKYEGIGYQFTDKELLLKMIQAELFTQYPNLGGEIGHEAIVEEGGLDEEIEEGSEEWTEEDTENQTSSNITSLDGFLFIGDSITQGFVDYGVAESNVTIKAKVGWDSDNWIKEFGDLTEKSDVKGINVLLGTNHYDYVFGSFKELMQKLHEKYPDVTIYVDKLLPDNQPTVNSTKRSEYISQVKSYCEGKSYLVYIDPTEGVEMQQTGCHPANKEACQKLWDNIKNEIINNGGTQNKEAPLILGVDTGEGTEGFQGGVRIRRVTPNKTIGELINTGDGEISSGQTMSGEYVGEISSYLIRSGVDGEWSVYAKNLKTGNETVQYNAENKKQSASLIKLFVMATAYQEIEKGSVSIDKELIRKMITVSDNDATNTIITTLGNGSAAKGFEKINGYIKENGYEKTEINRLMLQDATEGDNYTSTTDVAKILEAIYNEKCVSKSASVEMLNYLKAQERTSKIPAGVPNGVVTANKTGELNNVENDSAIVYKDGAPYILVVMSSGLSDTSGARENIKQISKIVYEKIDKNKEQEEKDKEDKKHTIALAVGHGENSGAGEGKDTTGTTNPTWKETEKVKEVIELVKKKLKSNKKITIVTEETGVSNTKKLEIAKEKNADVFIEVHLDSSSNTSTNGTSAYYQEESGKKSRQLAIALVDSVVSTLKTNQHDGAKEKDIQTFNDGKIDDFGGAAVILNGAYMSSKQDMEKLSGEEGLEKYAEGIVKGIEKYLEMLDDGRLGEDNNVINETYSTSVKSKIIEMKYIPQEEFDEMLEEANEDGENGKINDEILNYYTLDGDWNLITAKWSYSSVSGVSFSKNSAVPYRSVLQKYMTPFEYLMDYWIDIKEEDFVKAFAEMVMKSEFVIAVQDNVTTTHTTIDVQTVYSDGVIEQGTSTDEISESVTDNIELTYVDTWFVKFWKDSSYIFGRNTETEDGETEIDEALDVSYLNEEVSLMGKVTENNSSSNESKAGEPRYIYYNEELVNTIYSTIVITTNTHSIDNKYETGESNIVGNEEKFLKLFKDYPNALSRLKPKWLITLIGDNTRTSPMLDLTKYLLYKLLGDDFGVTKFDFSVYEPEDFASLNRWATDISLTKSVMDKETFVKAMQAYYDKTGNIAFKQNFLSRAEEIYDLGEKYNINPELIVTMALKESGFKSSGGNQNYWGWGTPNGAGLKYIGSFEEGVEKLAGSFSRYMEGSGTWEEQLILQKYNERQAANCNSNGYGKPGTLKGMLSIYSDLCGSDTKHREGDWGSGGNIYLRVIYGEEFNAKCGNVHRIGVDDYTIQERADYTAWLYEKQLEYWNDIFGEFASLGGDIKAVCEEVTKLFISRNATYGVETSNNIEKVYKSDKHLVCSTYVSVVLYRSGLMKAEDINKYNYHYTIDYPNMLKAAGWTQVDKSNLQPGDVLNKPGVGNNGHTVIYVGDGLIYDQTSAVTSSEGQPPTGQPKSVNGYIGAGYEAWRAP